MLPGLVEEVARIREKVNSVLKEATNFDSLSQNLEVVRTEVSAGQDHIPNLMSDSGSTTKRNGSLRCAFRHR